MDLESLLHINNVAVKIEARDKESLIGSVIDLIAADPAVENLKDIKIAILEREKIMSTGVGKGLALPHAKTKAVSGVVAALVTTAQPIDFDALDNEPVSIVFLLVGKPDAKSQHVRILSRVSRMMNTDETRNRILAANTGEELLAVIREHEQRTFSA